MHVKLRFDGDVAEALDIVQRILLSGKRSRLISRTDDAVIAKLGSSALFRTWGMFGPGRNRFPARVTATAYKSPEGADVTVDLIEDARPYLVSVSETRRRYEAQFQIIISNIESALPS